MNVPVCEYFVHFLLQATKTPQRPRSPRQVWEHLLSRRTRSGCSKKLPSDQFHHILSRVSTKLYVHTLDIGSMIPNAYLKIYIYKNRKNLQ